MDANVILISISLFIPVYLMGVVSNSKFFTIILAAASVVIVMVFAGQKYIFFDVMGVGAALFLAFYKINE